MKLMTLSKIYKNYNGNCTFDPATMEGRSYQWWSMVRRIGQLNVFNSYRYSVTTAKHQRETRRLIESLGIQIHADIEAPGGLQDLDSAIRLYEQRVNTLNEEIRTPRSQAKKNVQRADQIKELLLKIKQVRNLQKMVA